MQRKGAGAVYLNIFHLDVMRFLGTKKINADEKTRLQSLSLGLTVPNKFFELAEYDLPYFTFSPYDIKKEYDVYLQDLDMDEWYDKLVNNPNIRKEKLNARDMLSEIARTQLESGYPYMMYIDNSNDQNPLKDVGRIYMSNLCTEILQIQTLSDIQGYAGKDTIGEDVNCNLGSLNITNVMEKKMLKESVFLGMDALTVVAEETSIDAVPTVKKGNESFHSVGLGAMNLHGYLAKNHIVYTSDIAKDFVNTFFMTMNFYSLQRSMEIAKERGVSFKGFEKSEYANGRYFDKYITTCFQPKTDRVKELFEGQYIPTMEDWKQLKEDVMKYGVFHSYRQAIAPTQSISYVQNATSALMPITQQIETRTYGDSTTHYPMPYMTNQNIHFYQPAYEMNMYKYLDLMAVAQQHIDQGISTILFVNSDTTTRELARLYVYANKIGLKTLYYTRTRKLTLEECESCAV